MRRYLPSGRCSGENHVGSPEPPHCGAPWRARWGGVGPGYGAMAYSVAQAAKAIGKSKNTVLRAISAGRISAVRDAATGGFQIDPSELHRVFAPAPTAPHGASYDAPDGAIRVAVL